MTVRERRCPSCGKTVSRDSRFCLYCGKELSADEKKVTGSNTLTCPVCGREAEKGAKFCLGCGKPLKQIVPKQNRKAAVPAMTKPSVITGMSAGLRLSALTSAGEMDLGEMGNTISAAVGETAPVRQEVTEVLSPIAGIGKTIGTYLGGLFSMFAKPKVLLYAVFMAGLWTVLGMLKNSGSDFLQALSWLTCAEGGIFAKGCTALMLSSLFSGGIGSTFKGIGALFSRKDGKGSILFLVMGIVFGAVSCTGITLADPASTIAGISGALLSLQAVGRQDGLLYQLAESLTSAKNNGVRIARSGKAKSLLTGLTLGFAAITAIMALGV